MKIYTIILVALTSCALLDGYKDNQHSWFEEGLTSEEKAKIKSEGFIHKEWIGPDIQGMLFITPLEGKNNNYNFVEIGEWTEERSYESDGITRGIDKRQTMYDQYGNILSRRIWDKPKKAAEFYLLEEWTSTYRVTNADSLLIQHIITFHPNGNKEWDFKLAVEDYKTKLSDRLKNKQKIDTLYRFASDGKLIETKVHQLIN